MARAGSRRPVRRPDWVTAVAVASVLLGGIGADLSWDVVRRGAADLWSPPEHEIPCYRTRNVGGVEVRIAEPDWYDRWELANGLVLLAASACYIVSAAFLWKLRYFAVWTTVAVAAVSVCHIITVCAVEYAAFGSTGWTRPGDEWVVAIFHVLIAVFAVGGEKQAFRAPAAGPSADPPGGDRGRP